MKSDFHMHTKFSSDSTSNPEEMVKHAIGIGLDTICFTDHFDKDYPDQNNGKINEFQLDIVPYFETITVLKEKYAGKMDIRIGVEFGLQPHLGEFYRKLVQSYPFDFVIGSVHVVDGKDPYYASAFEGKTDEELYRQTFEETLVNIQKNQDFDVLGHIDYVVRYGKTQAKNYSYKKYADIIDEILKYLIAHGKGIELNTAGYKYGIGFCHPHPDIIKRYKELGGEIITIGSDGHKPEHLAYDFYKVSDILKSCGFKVYTEFKDRKPNFRQLP